MKRISIILLSLLMVFAVLPMEARATESGQWYFTDDTGIKWIYTLDEEGFAEVIGNNDSSRQELTVPPVMDGHRVLYIGSGALSSHSWVTAINLPKDIVSIGNAAFASCTGLQSITIPEGVTSIGLNAFNRCTSLTSITIPDSVTSIGNNAFQYCESLESANLGSGITAIPHQTFSDCTSLTSITIPSSVTSIGERAFFHCDNLESVTISDGVTSIGEAAFYYCSKLKHLFLPGSVATIGDELFYSNSNNPGIVYGPENPAAEAYFEQYTDWTYKRLGADCLTYTKNNGTCTITGCDSHVLCPSFPIPAQIDGCTVTGIAADAFKDCKGIKGIEIPNTVTSIGDSAFSGCTGLATLTIPESVKSIGNSAFAGCTGLTSLQLGSGVTSIGDSAFQNCSGLSSVSLPENVKNIGDAVFSGCTGLRSITIPDSVESIGASVFYGCTGLGTITIPNKVTTIGANTFSGCTGLVSVSLPDGMTEIGEAAFKDCSGLVSIALPDTVTTIGSSAFEGCESLTAVTIPAGVTAIGSSVYKNCAGMETVVLSNCTAIGDYAFSGIADGTVLYYPGTNAEWESVTKGTDAVPASCTVRTYDDQTETVEVNVSGLETGDQLILTDGLGTRREITESGSYGVWPKDTKLTVKAGEGRRYEGTLAYQQADGSMAFVSQISNVGSPIVELALNNGTPCVSLTFDDGGTRSYRLIVNEQILDNLGTSPSWKIRSGEQEYHNGDVLYTESGGMAAVKYFTLELSKPEGYTCEGGLYGAKNGSCIVKITDEATYDFNSMSISDEDVILSLVWFETGARHTATVDGGLGSGKYRKDESVTITAAAPADGKIFDQWTGTEGVSFADSASATTTFTMPDADVTVTATYKDMDTVAAPTFDPAGGTYYSEQSVALSGATEGATIYYTTDGSTPTINSRKYTKAISVTETTTIKAIAVKKDMKDSEVTEAVYTITEEPTYFLIVGVPPFDEVTVGYTQPAAKAITIKNTGNNDVTISSVTLSGDGQNAFSLNKTTSMTIEAGATDNTTYTIQPKDGLAVGTYTAEVAVAYDNDKVERAAVSFTVNSDEMIDTVAAPTFSPGAGEVTSGTDITLSCETEGATILYDIGGSNDPSAEYTGPIRITETTTISAIAIRKDMSPSDVVTATYTIQASTSETYAVTFKAAGGTWTDGTTADKQVTVEKGSAATAPADPTRDRFTFDGWDKDFSNVTSNLTVTAKWKQNASPTPSTPVSIKYAKVVLSATAFTYNGKVRKPSIKTIGGKTLTAGTDYTVRWSKASPKNVRSYTVTITGKGKYTGTTKASYKINPKGTSLGKLVKGKKSVTVKWKKQTAKMAKSRITGYQIQLATDTKFTRNKKTVTVKGYKKATKKVSKLKGKKTYYIRIRTYKAISGKKYYSPWSKAKAVKTL